MGNRREDPDVNFTVGTTPYHHSPIPILTVGGIGRLSFYVKPVDAGSTLVFGQDLC